VALTVPMAWTMPMYRVVAIVLGALVCTGPAVAQKATSSS